MDVRCLDACVAAAAILYRRLKHYLLTEEQLVENGFPQSHASVSGTAVIRVPQQEKSSTVFPSPNCTCSTLLLSAAHALAALLAISGSSWFGLLLP